MTSNGMKSNRLLAAYAASNPFPWYLLWSLLPGTSFGIELGFSAWAVLHGLLGVSCIPSVVRNVHYSFKAPEITYLLALRSVVATDVAIGVYAASYTLVGSTSWLFYAVVIPLAAYMVLVMHRYASSRSVACRASGFVCDRCLYSLHRLPLEGNCPECGKAYAISELRKIWRVDRDGAESY